MGLESGTFVDDLVTTNPLGTESKSQGDDHLRLIKAVLKNTFKGATRAFQFPACPAAKTDAYSVLLTDQNALLRGDASSGTFIITLPAGSAVFAGYEVTIMKSDSSANAVTVDGSGSETINGGADRTLDEQYISETYMFDGVEWKIVATYTEIAQAVIGDGVEIDSGALRVKLDGTSLERGSDGMKRAVPHDQKTDDYTAVLADNGKLIEMDKATAVTLTLTAVATLVEGWFIEVNNSGAGTLTIDADGTEKIDDAETLTLLQGESLRIVSDGAAFWTVGRRPLIAGTIAKAYARFVPPAGNGACTVSKSFNVDSVTKTATGKFTVTWTDDFADTDYIVLATAHEVTVSGNSIIMSVPIGSAAVGSCALTSYDTSGSNADAEAVSVVAFGDQ